MTKEINASDWSYINMTLADELPEFKKLIDEATEKRIVIHQKNYGFGTKLGQLALLGVAIKYATVLGKDVLILKDNDDQDTLTN